LKERVYRSLPRIAVEALINTLKKPPAEIGLRAES
jgi:hypothetical protein